MNGPAGTIDVVVASGLQDRLRGLPLDDRADRRRRSLGRSSPGEHERGGEEKPRAQAEVAMRAAEERGRTRGGGRRGGRAEEGEPRRARRRSSSSRRKKGAPKKAAAVKEEADGTEEETSEEEAAKRRLAPTIEPFPAGNKLIAGTVSRIPYGPRGKRRHKRFFMPRRCTADLVSTQGPRFGVPVSHAGRDSLPNDSVSRMSPAGRRPALVSAVRRRAAQQQEQLGRLFEFLGGIHRIRQRRPHTTGPWFASSTARASRAAVLIAGSIADRPAGSTARPACSARCA